MTDYRSGREESLCRALKGVLFGGDKADLIAPEWAFGPLREEWSKLFAQAVPRSITRELARWASSAVLMEAMHEAQDEASEELARSLHGTTDTALMWARVRASGLLSA